MRVRGGEAVMQWSSVRVCLGSLVRSPDISWPLFIIWYHRRLAKDYPNCCHTVLRRDLQCLYVFEALAAISLSSFSRHSRENVRFRGVTFKKSKKIRPASIKKKKKKPTGANGFCYKKICFILQQLEWQRREGKPGRDSILDAATLTHSLSLTNTITNKSSFRIRSPFDAPQWRQVCYSPDSKNCQHHE